ncbi:ATP-binding protein [Candidatus Woesearchaeota archaeon]|nr:ATP-binding protein [Candidatus Woesearchaeota archaeon]
MDKNILAEILNDWNCWKNNLESGKPRDNYVDLCLRYLDVNVATTIIGVRRSGKSYLMRQMIRKLIAKGIDKKNILMVNFDDKRFTEFYPELLDEIYSIYLELMMPDKMPFVFFDEIQNVPNWERWVRTMHELGKAKIIISGSSSKMLHGELATLLTGRHLDIFIFPLSLSEILGFKQIHLNDKLDIISRSHEIRNALNELFEYGGFPEVLLSKEKKQLLLAYFDDILVNDIEKRYNIHESQKLRSLARFYLTNASNTITFNSLSKHLSLSPATIEKFTSYFEEVNLLFFIKRFSFKVKEQEKAARKVYSIDVGLSNAIGFQFSQNIGKIIENITAIELKKQEKLDPNTEIYYWQDVKGKEVDFVVKRKQNVEQLIQVCQKMDELKTKEREIHALLIAGSDLKCRNLLVITLDYEAEEYHEWFGMKGKIKFLPIMKWLLRAFIPI